tara:strand:- start:358 stop:813 length:456 start_codon:yes stop_codon:yes gene_type:complete
MDEQLKQLILERSGGIISTRMAWERATSSALQSGMPEGQLAVLVEHLSGHDVLSSYLDAYASIDVSERGVPFATVWSDLETRIDDSQFSMKSWLNALSVLLRYLKKEGRMCSLSILLGYLSCSAEFAYSKGVSVSLSEVVDEMLKEFGFDG